MYLFSAREPPAREGGHQQVFHKLHELLIVFVDVHEIEITNGRVAIF